MDTFGNPKFVYSWKLVPTDKIPAGKRPDLSLREKIKQIQKDLDDGIDTIGKKMTVCQLYAKYIRQRGNVKRGMTLNYYAHATFQSAQAEMARLEAAKVETTVVAVETTVENTEETKAAA